MKLLFSIALLTLFSALSFAQNPIEGAESSIIAGKGWGVVGLGVKRKIIEEKLGVGTERSKYDDVYFVDYPKNGLQISYTNKKDEAYTIFFYNNQKRYENFVTLKVKTDKDISWISKPEDVLEAYGKPENDFKDESGQNAWQRIEYKGIDFLFELGKLKRIGIHTGK